MSYAVKNLALSCLSLCLYGIRLASMHGIYESTVGSPHVFMADLNHKWQNRRTNYMSDLKFAWQHRIPSLIRINKAENPPLKCFDWTRDIWYFVPSDKSAPPSLQFTISPVVTTSLRQPRTDPAPLSLCWASSLRSEIACRPIQPAAWRS